MARMIDADILQELCNKRIKDTWNSNTAPVSWAEAYADFKDDIDSIPTLTPPNDWISVEDRMPAEEKYNGAVLATGGDIVITAPSSSVTRTGAITHWMPLPKPPKEAQP